MNSFVRTAAKMALFVAVLGYASGALVGAEVGDQSEVDDLFDDIGEDVDEAFAQESGGIGVAEDMAAHQLTIAEATASALVTAKGPVPAPLVSAFAYISSAMAVGGTAVVQIKSMRG